MMEVKYFVKIFSKIVKNESFLRRLEGGITIGAWCLHSSMDGENEENKRKKFPGFPC